MPSCTTHTIFGKSVMKKTNITNLIDHNVYNIFNQSFDNLMYYNFFKIKKKKIIQNLSKTGHRKKTKAYLMNIIKFIKKYNLKNDKQCLAYLYGSINHYTLDSIVHPFVFYKTGVYKEKQKETFKYNGLHTKMEAMLNVYFYEKNNSQKYYKSKFYKEDFPKVKFNDKLISLIDKIFLETYNEKNIGKIYYNCYKNGKLIFKFGVYDRFKVKKIIYTFIDLFRKNKKKIKYVSYHYKNVDYNYLNLDHKNWLHPVTKQEYNYSIDDLYEIALKKSETIINSINKVLFENKDLNYLENKIDDISYITGLPCNDSGRMKYFEF